MKRPFDNLSNRFSRNIYATPKGQLRLALLQQDLKDLQSAAPLSILDAGGGQGQMSRWFATAGHQVVLCDAAEEMIAQAQAGNAAAPLAQRVELQHASIEQFCEADERRFDLVLCHAVLEWADQPQAILTRLIEKLTPGGQLSLMFYNRHALVLKNLLNGNFRQVKRDDWRGDGGTLTPVNPLEPDDMYACLAQQQMQIELNAGVRCIYDYLPRKVRETYAFEDILEMEQRHRHQLPYRQMARYIHVLAHRPK